MKVRLVWLTLLMASAGCVDKNAHYDGTIQGQSFDVADAAYFSKYYSAETLGTNQSVSATVVALSTSYRMCDDVTQQVVYPNEQFLVFVFGQTDANGLMPLSGQYAVGEDAEYGTDSSSCQPNPAINSTGGTLTFSGGNYAAGANADATFDITFASGDHGSGGFTATPCGSMETFLDKIVAAAFGGPALDGPVYLIEGTCS